MNRFKYLTPFASQEMPEDVLARVKQLYSEYRKETLVVIYSLLILLVVVSLLFSISLILAPFLVLVLMHLFKIKTLKKRLVVGTITILIFCLMVNAVWASIIYNSMDDLSNRTATGDFVSVGVNPVNSSEDMYNYSFIYKLSTENISLNETPDFNIIIFSALDSYDNITLHMNKTLTGSGVLYYGAVHLSRGLYVYYIDNGSSDYIYYFGGPVNEDMLTFFFEHLGVITMNVLFISGVPFYILVLIMNYMANSRERLIDQYRKEHEGEWEESTEDMVNEDGVSESESRAEDENTTEEQSDN